MPFEAQKLEVGAGAVIRVLELGSELDLEWLERSDPDPEHLSLDPIHYESCPPYFFSETIIKLYRSRKMMLRIRIRTVPVAFRAGKPVSGDLEYFFGSGLYHVFSFT
jgi:hypothetical protein